MRANLSFATVVETTGASETNTGGDQGREPTGASEINTRRDQGREPQGREPQRRIPQNPHPENSDAWKHSGGDVTGSRVTYPQSRSAGEHFLL